MTNLDFLIMSHARTGTHMLGYALDSHPDIRLIGDIRGRSPDYKGRLSNEGRVVGGSTNQPVEIPRVCKIIAIRRNPYYIINSVTNDKINHHFSPPGVIIASDPDDDAIEHAAEKQEMLLNHVSTFPEHLILEYDELTGNKHIDVLSEEHSYLICDFLEVERRVLNCSTFKPTYETFSIGGEQINRVV